EIGDQHAEQTAGGEPDRLSGEMCDQGKEGGDGGQGERRCRLSKRAMETERRRRGQAICLVSRHCNRTEPLFAAPRSKQRHALLPNGTRAVFLARIVPNVVPERWPSFCISSGVSRLKGASR